MRTRLLLTVVILLLFGAPVAAQWRKEGKIVPDEPWRRQKGDLAVSLMITADPNGFLEQWNRAPSLDYKPQIKTASTVPRGGTVMGFVIFSGCKPNAAGSCDATVDWILLKPDGTVYADQKGAVLWKGKAMKDILMLSETNLGLQVEQDDPLGEYTMKAAVHDQVEKVSVEVEAKLTVVASE